MILRIVLDTNVLLSGLMLSDSTPGKIVNAWRKRNFYLAVSEPMLEEIARVLAYTKIKKRLNWDDEQITRYIALLRFEAELVSIVGVEANVPADPNDNHLLATLICFQPMTCAARWVTNLTKVSHIACTLRTLFGLTSSANARFMKLIPTILCGGAGSRLWPVSRELHPKPFIRLADGQSLLQKTWLRGAVLPDVAEMLTVTNRELFFKTEDEYREMAAIPANKDLANRFILEPFGP